MATLEKAQAWWAEEVARMGLIAESAKTKFGEDLGAAYVNFVTKKGDIHAGESFSRVLAESEDIHQTTRAQTLELLIKALEGRGRKSGRTTLSYLEETLGIK